MSRLHGMEDCDLTLCKHCLLFHRPFMNCRVKNRRQNHRQSNRQSHRQSNRQNHHQKQQEEQESTPFDSQRLLLLRPQPVRKEGAAKQAKAKQTERNVRSLEDTQQEIMQWRTDTVPEIEVNFTGQGRFFEKKHWKKKSKGYRKWR